MDMCVKLEDVQNVVNEAIKNHEKYVNTKFEGNEKLMEEKFNSNNDLMEERFKSINDLFKEQLNSNYHQTKGDFNCLNTKLDAFTTQESKINCIENKMFTKSAAATSLKIGISIIVLGVGLIAYFV